MSETTQARLHELRTRADWHAQHVVDDPFYRDVCTALRELAERRAANESALTALEELVALMDAVPMHDIDCPASDDEGRCGCEEGQKRTLIEKAKGSLARE